MTKHHRIFKTDKHVSVTKASGETVPFEESKLRTSLKRAGASEADVDRVVSNVRKQIQDGMSTADIYLLAYDTLRSAGQPVVSRYSMKKAVFGLGPSGFPFERFIAEIFKADGYEVLTDVIVKGKCVKHEIDLIARRAGAAIVAEIKFHNKLGIKSDLKVPLYVKSRFDDIEKVDREYERKNRWLITNTKFSRSALAYGKCAGIHMVDWSHPADGNLQILIEKSGVQPVTCLTSLNESDKKKLIESGLVLCRHINGPSSDLEKIGISGGKAELASAESSTICGVSKW